MLQFLVLLRYAFFKLILQPLDVPPIIMSHIVLISLGYG